MAQVQLNAANVQSNGNNNNMDDNEPYQISDTDLDDLDDDCLLEEAELPGGANSLGRGPYERAWTTDATRALIHIRGPMEGNFTEGRQKRTALWLHCTRQLQRLGFRYSAAKVQKKWHNILITYNKNLTKKYVSGYVHWEFFEEMFKYLQGKKADMSQQSNPAPQPQPQQTQVQPPNQQEQQQQPLQQQQQPLQPQQQLQMQLQKPQAELGIFQATPVTPQITLQLKEGQGQPYLTPVDQVLLQEQMNLDSKSNDEFDEDSSNSLSEVREPKLEYDADQEQAAEAERTNDSSQQQLETTNGKMFDMAPSHGQALTDNIWWKDYFERKLDVEREKIDLQRSMQREQVQIQKMSMVQQERIERMKIDAINSLTGTLQKLVEAKCRRA